MNPHNLPRWATGLLLPVLNLLSALLVAGLVILALGESPTESLAILVNSAYLNPEGLGYTLFYATTFLFTGLAVAFALHAGLFNIGGEGQMYLGGLGMGLVLLALDSRLPGYLLIPLALIGSAAFGAAWAFVPGYLQAKRGSHIVVTTIMFNFIAANLMNYVIVSLLVPVGQQTTASREFAKSAWLPRLNEWLPGLGQTPLNISFLLALLAAAGYAVLVWRTSWGYRVRTVGANPQAAHYAGISIQNTLISVMAISGALAGVAALNSEMGSTHRLGLNFTAGAGFVGIAVALMGRKHPLGMFFSALLFGGLIQGGFDLSLEKPNIPPETFVFIQGLIILFCGALENLYAPALAALLARWPTRTATTSLSER
jgi:simple sugar transport system permease protein